MKGVGGATLLVAALLVGCVTKRIREEPPVIRVDAPPAGATRAAGATRDTASRVEATDIPRDEAPRVRVEGPRDVRVALATAAQGAILEATGGWRLYDAHNAVLVRARAGDSWSVERRGRLLRATAPRGGATPWSEGPLTVRPDGDSFVLFAQRRYRGALRVTSTDSTLVVVNVLPVDAYLRGVVPLEIGGPRAANEQAAVEAQAIAARSYTFVRLAAAEGSASRNAAYDMLSGVSDQVYGGADAERPFSDRAVAATTGQVITYGGRIVSAPYHSTCGGETASPDEVWRAGPEPYLRRVSDRIPGTSDRYYCDIAPRFAWTRTFTSAELDAAVRANLRNYVTVPSGGPGHVRSVAVDQRTPSGRVARLAIATDRGTFVLRGNDTRYVLR
ncbi:MAG: SpoIID/LytB domain-containing protein, partial [Gemmatimonadetes bacterium]|nr:SpoIID/LytB domain-containing protein [Gemmatimonadota bacterium]